MYMKRCLQLAENGLLTARPNPMVGAVIVHDGRIIGEGYHIKCGEGHAEVNAFASVSAEDEALLPQSTMYVSLEPCSHYGKTPPCADLIIKKGVRKVVVGCVDPFAKVQGRGIEKLRTAGIDVTEGVLKAQCLWLNRRFITYHTQHRPYILLKWAQTVDGFLDDHFSPIALSTPFTRMLVHKLRSEYEAIVVGRTTDDREHPQLNVRYWSGPNPKRYVLSRSKKSANSAAKMSPTVFSSIADLLAKLYEDGVQSLLVEGGPMTHQSFIDAGLWDEIRVETSPKVVGVGTRVAFLPSNIRLLKQEFYDKNVIETYVSNYEC